MVEDITYNHSQRFIKVGHFHVRRQQHCFRLQGRDRKTGVQNFELMACSVRRISWRKRSHKNSYTYDIPFSSIKWPNSPSKYPPTFTRASCAFGSVNACDHDQYSYHCRYHHATDSPHKHAGQRKPVILRCSSQSESHDTRFHQPNNLQQV